MSKKKPFNADDAYPDGNKVNAEDQEQGERLRIRKPRRRAPDKPTDAELTELLDWLNKTEQDAKQHRAFNWFEDRCVLVIRDLIREVRRLRRQASVLKKHYR